MQFLPNNAKRSVITRDMCKALNSSRTTASRKSTSASEMRSVSFVDESAMTDGKLLTSLRLQLSSELHCSVLEHHNHLLKIAFRDLNTLHAFKRISK